MIYDLFADPWPWGASAVSPAAARPEARPPALLWGMAWRLVSVELLALLLAGDILPWMPPGTLPLSILAIATWGLPLGLWRRSGLAPAVWRVLAAGALLAAALGRPAALVVALALASILCVGEPLALAARRHATHLEPNGAGAHGVPPPLLGSPLS